MKLRTVAPILSSLLMILAAGLCFAQVPPPPSCIEVAFEDASIDQATVFTDPFGHSGYGLDDCFENGNQIDATLKVRVFANGVITSDFPRQRIKLVIVDGYRSYPAGGVYRECPGTGNLADENTDQNGYTTITAPRFFGRGTVSTNPSHDITYRIYVDWNGTGLWKVEYNADNILLKTPDVTGDGVVNLADIATFSGYYNTVEVDPQIDYNDDGLENMSDIVMFQSGWGMSCGGTKSGGPSLSVEDVLAEIEKAAKTDQATWGAVRSLYR